MLDKIKLFQIAYNQETWDQVHASGFLPLDNMANPRPDWYEYWPIRNFLLSTPLEEDSWYGFFSPKFTEKTQLSHVQVQHFVAEAATKKNADVALFSPQPDMGANFLSVFEQAELFDPGFIQVAKQFLQTMGLQIPLEGIVMDSRQIVFSNYFVAKPAFWRDWFIYTEALFAIAEDTSHPLHQALCHNTSYSENAQRKVFLSERLASLILSLKPAYKVVVANPFNFAWSASKFRQRPDDTYINDALKMAFRETGFPQYMDVFKKIRSRI